MIKKEKKILTKRNLHLTFIDINIRSSRSVLFIYVLIHLYALQFDNMLPKIA